MDQVPQTTMPAARFSPGYMPSASALERMYTLLRNIRGRNGVKVTVRENALIIEGTGLGMDFSGIVYLAGQRFYDADSTDTTGTIITDASTAAAKTWIKVDVANNTVTYQDGPAPIPFPSGEEWYERAKTSGDIHITRF